MVSIELKYKEIYLSVAQTVFLVSADQVQREEKLVTHINKIELSTLINAPIERCFNLSLSIDLHKISTAHTNEEAIAGTTSGLIKLNETVTWRARHFGLWHKLQVKITELEEQVFFVDEMVKGSFKKMKHRHTFVETETGTMMLDVFEFSSPFGWLGALVDKLVLRNYLRSLLLERNRVIKEFAETDKWKELLNSD